MILPDANLLLYAYNASAREHALAKVWWEDTLSSPEPVALSWQTMTAFLRISTNHRAFPQPLTIEEAMEAVDAWLKQPMVRLVAPGDRHWAIFNRLLVEGQCTGPMVMDAHLAALAIEHGATLYTHDRDFSRFSALATADPLLPT
jgi:toxin-antitoxin system PIN domain toxin